MSSDSQFATNDLLNFHLMESPDPNRFTSSALNLGQLTMTTSAATCSKDILSTTQIYMVAEDNEDHLLLIEQVVESRENIKNVKMRRGKGDILAELPSLPLEEELFSPPVDKSNRKERSIKVLVEAFVVMMPEKGKMLLKLDALAMKLDINIKRLYTICNVLEALRIIVRQGMNVYEWQGWQVMMTTLALLRQIAEQQDTMGQLAKTTQIVESDTRLNIGMMTEKLLMVFLVIPQPKVLSLAVASSFVHGPVLNNKKRRCALQKLTDISNILQTVGLLMKVKVKVGDDKKTFAYQYIGQEVELLPVVNRDWALTGQARVGCDRQEGEKMSGSENRKEGEKMSGNENRKEGEKMSGNENRKEEEKMTGNENRKEGEKMIGNESRKDGEKMTGYENRKDGEKMTGFENRKEGEKSTGNEGRKEGEKMTGIENRKEGEVMSGKGKRKKSKFSMGRQVKLLRKDSGEKENDIELKNVWKSEVEHLVIRRKVVRLRFFREGLEKIVNLKKK